MILTITAAAGDQDLTTTLEREKFCAAEVELIKIQLKQLLAVPHPSFIVSCDKLHTF